MPCPAALVAVEGVAGSFNFFFFGAVGAPVVANFSPFAALFLPVSDLYSEYCEPSSLWISWSTALAWVDFCSFGSALTERIFFVSSRNGARLNSASFSKSEAKGLSTNAIRRVNGSSGGGVECTLHDARWQAELTLFS